MKNLVILFLMLMIAVPCSAVQYCDEVTLSIDIEESRWEEGYGGRMIGFELEIPAEGANGVIFNFKTGERYGKKESVWGMSYKFVMPR